MAALLPEVVRINITEVISVTPTITASSAYAATAQLGGIITIPNIVRQNRVFGGGLPSGSTGGSCELRSITILDSSNQKAAIDFWFFNTSPTITSSDHSTFAMTSANFLAQAIGSVSVGTSYSSNGTLAQSSDGKAIGLPFQIPYTVSVPNNIYAVAIVQGTPTYTSTSALQFQFGFYVD